MSDIYIEKEPFGVGAVLSESFSILFRKFFPIFVIGFLLSCISMMSHFVIAGKEIALGLNPDLSAIYGGYAILAFIIQQIMLSYCIAIIVQLAYDLRSNTPLRYTHYSKTAFRYLLPLTILSTVVSLLGGFGLVLLIVPGIWIYAVWSVVTPAVIIEGKGFQGLARSAELTVSYRWPIIGLIMLAGLIVIICMAPLAYLSTYLIGLDFFAIDVLPSAASISNADIMLYIAINSLANALMYGFSGVVIAMIYIRLREIKDGIATNNVAEVFS
ncbi:hypothetical protein [Parasulfitobacter algicola]|uniref:Glycerophosphoryl diester phosphodiesterase membrane domain-containing protein n=1 Tax=Parasulfitobacter algicola TaxID=2614809 RepID=A0ABX2IKC2_9RHOB|nr:hypothetical protein [Sulfitobacter algicola]NSX53298.1 hypothetical protein [Sulfitobacter algicola]